MPSIHVSKCADPAIKLAHRIAEVVRSKPNCVLGLATGSTPIPVYQELARLHREEGLDFSQVRTFNLDEYAGLPPTHDQSYRFFMEEHLFSKVNIKPENVHFLNGMASDYEKECERYEQELKAIGPCDVWLLGIGHNGHIAFNEPGSPRDSRTRVVCLTQSTIDANARFFGNDKSKVPTKALSVGIATIMESREILLLATGESKREAVTKSVKGKCETHCPASFLHEHPHCRFYVDMDAGKEVDNTCCQATNQASCCGSTSCHAAKA
ncbi:Glucosamine-6-phosphate deaminase [Giardia duodenalis]|uniref:Glucosamine-6-phosphate isomerase n=2 Tax=Giardia intestinalis TaxID=5741 RepID=E2RU05_GIAIC|nr:Glucosamine-6-phosphate deaminase [Giardia intestinalis]AAF03257.1 glucosamine 6-phosphate isomerase [Giardia intestinalis]KAE8301872.1 Glucosamine-6-phosphate deaminase [Giardia intestinalis]|eukprot:XP_001709043.1 Glucosamine-6-phosphate deaminase [Giardia lamblia ATCC 50803]